MNYTLHHGDCLDILRTLPDNSVDAIVTDPPYGLSFMGKRWDYDVPSEDIWRECLRVLKPGGHLLAFAGTRTQHRMAVRIEDAGFEIRDMIAWVYGSGFPKSHDVSKAIDKASGAERPRIPGGQGGNNAILGARKSGEAISGEAISDAVRQWHGWGTALKPALEPITVARKPLIGTVAENVLTWGTGGVNVDGCRVGTEPTTTCAKTQMYGTSSRAKDQEQGFRPRHLDNRDQPKKLNPPGRWPANLIHDGSEEVVGLFPDTKTNSVGKAHGKTIDRAEYTGQNVYGKYNAITYKDDYADSGSAARFFYCAKASKRDRDEGLQIAARAFVQFQTGNGASGKPSSLSEGRSTEYRNFHPTVKPTDLMRYLCRLVTPPNGTVLDPFMGSGSTGKAALLEHFAFIGIEREAEYLDIARARIEHAINNKPNKLL